MRARTIYDVPRRAGVSHPTMTIAFLFLQRYWESGLTAGGVKG